MAGSCAHYTHYWCRWRSRRDGSRGSYWSAVSCSASVRAWTAGTEHNLGAVIVGSRRGPVVLWSLILGLHLASQNSGIPSADLGDLPRTLAVLWIWSLTVALSRLAGNAVGFYGGRVTGTQSVTSLTRKLAQLAVVALGLAGLLRVFDVSLTPILTTLGVGGLAVASALQDTLSNLFAGFYVSISGLVHIGDYIKLNTVKKVTSPTSAGAAPC